ncbi:metallophosphoesterase [Halomonas urumqiensis]|uniref:Serine/threonine protein phosphatase n=1 Tax=Halomonas urumqiensis TaxID=1684789 RepID=A0A2N7UKQ9_9GAMM|nr:metallophosphoesterase [Halomonas urumqiensis]PMR81025.1 serine/threonine protein phosphatase [Halomonas urumqiensis]PTB01118.1 serine/threonine protein phosphatase [Halomonas urumqiensis]GHE22847.1 ser/threonine protein phosphatase [Halomonas urumqiensis]
MKTRARLEGYDLIGDVHGCGATLAALLEKLGYHQRGGVYRHPRRRVIFLGDLIDRGPRIRLAVRIARRMVEEGEAHIVMGNHEVNALAYCHPAPGGLGRDWLREHSPRHNRIIMETLEQYRDHPQEWEDALAWFMDIPLCLERDGLRVVHACWDQPLIDELRLARPDACIDRNFLVDSATPGTRAFRILDRLTRGIHIPLPAGMAIHSGDGYTRRSFRAHFWAEAPCTWGDVVFQPDNLPGELEQRSLSSDERAMLSHYGVDQPPLFIGHYWCEGVPALPAPNIACLDYSAVKFGRLVAYRWSGERRLDADNFTWLSVPREEQTRPRPWEIDLD